MKVLVTGGAGYIGSHTTLSLLTEGHDVVVLDNLSNSRAESLVRVGSLAGKEVDLRLIDLLDAPAVDRLIGAENFDAVIHFAGLKAVGESVEEPLKYYTNNVVGTINLLHSMDKYGLRKLVFSSSATVYGNNLRVPLTEDFDLSATNPYGRTKEHIEDILTDLGSADERWSIALLRYFNPAGAHASGQIGEDPLGTPNNLLPFVAQVAIGRHERVKIFGNDYPTADGTGVRDYIHVVDLALGHLAALQYIDKSEGVFKWNLGTGRGYSVLEVLAAFSAAVGREIPFDFVARRAGDSAVSYADVSSAMLDLGWSAGRSLAQMCEDHWRWQRSNPEGYR